MFTNGGSKGEIKRIKVAVAPVLLPRLKRSIVSALRSRKEKEKSFAGGFIIGRTGTRTRACYRVRFIVASLSGPVVSSWFKWYKHTCASIANQSPRYYERKTLGEKGERVTIFLVTSPSPSPSPSPLLLLQPASRFSVQDIPI